MKTIEIEITEFDVHDFMSRIVEQEQEIEWSFFTTDGEEEIKVVFKPMEQEEE